MTLNWRDFIVFSEDYAPADRRAMEVYFDRIAASGVGQEMLSNLKTVQARFHAGAKLTIAAPGNRPCSYREADPATGRSHLLFASPENLGGIYCVTSDKTIAEIPQEYMLFHELCHASHIGGHEPAGKGIAARVGHEKYATEQTDRYVREMNDARFPRHSYLNGFGLYTLDDNGQLIDHLKELGISPQVPMTQDQLARLFIQHLLPTLQLPLEKPYAETFLQHFLPERVELRALLEGPPPSAPRVEHVSPGQLMELPPPGATPVLRQLVPKQPER